jgi:dienelactone hydrolase
VSRETYRWAVVLLAAVALVAGCGGGSDSKESGLAAPFAYDASKSLELQTRGTQQRPGGVEVRDISYVGPAGGRINAYLLVPGKRERLPAVIYVHGAGGTREELLGEAARLARRGAVALVLEMSYSPQRARPLPTSGIPAVRARTEIETDSVREVSRAVDLLREQPAVDGDRIGYVGWSAGARMGAIVAGVEHRIRAVDLIAGGATPISEYLDLAPPDLRAELEPLLTRTDPLRYVGHAAPSALFFQNGRADEIVPRPALVALARAGSKPKQVRWYDTGHVPGERAWADSRRWLAGKLDFS